MNRPELRGVGRNAYLRMTECRGTFQFTTVRLRFQRTSLVVIGLRTKPRLRMIETRNGILLIPLTGEPMSPSLRAEIEEWQALGTESFELFPYESD